ncbi:MAG: hypothetical protein J2P15_01490 [Micromonosporaceae bacterium]|nr:hypothetical protein [Micromonosporaceae bacterium]
MFDNSYIATNRDRRVEPHARLDAGFESARLVRFVALLAIATRLFYIYASANRISVTHTLLGLFNANATLDANGRLDLTGQPDGGAGLLGRAHDADALVTIAVVASVIGIILFVLALFSLSRRKKRGDAVATAIDSNRGARIAGRVYVLVAIVAVIARNAFNPSPGAPPVDRLHTLLAADTATIGFQILVIGILLAIALAAGREIRRARAGGRTG